MCGHSVRGDRFELSVEKVGLAAASAFETRRTQPASVLEGVGLDSGACSEF
jgi:hypothetical protein